MNPYDLPVVGVISNTNKDFFGKFGELSDKKILCIGFSQDELALYVSKYRPSKVTVLTKWVDHVDAQVTGCDFVVGDITEATPFDDDAFDAVLTLSVLEHLADLDAAFLEMSRVLRHNGEMLHMFGPAWSCAYGHHIYADANMPLLNFSMWQMPAHIHLLCSKKRIFDYYLESGLGEREASAALHWFYETPIINRVFFDDYNRIFQSSNLQIDELELMHNELPIDHLQLLRRRYPGRWDFSTYGAKVKLINRKR